MQRPVSQLFKNCVLLFKVQKNTFSIVKRQPIAFTFFQWSSPSFLRRYPESHSISSPHRLSLVRGLNSLKPAEAVKDTETTMPEKKAFERLPVDVVPSNYNICLKPNLKAFTFDGNETISVEVSRLSQCFRKYFFIGSV